MKRGINVTLLAFAIVVFGSCSKNIFSNGELVDKQYLITEPFRNIEFCDDVNVTLKHCDENHAAGTIHIRTGKNLIDSITTTIQKDGGRNRLVIHNKNTYNYLRPYDYQLDMTVWYDSIYMIVFNSNGTVTTDTLKGIQVIDSITTDSIIKKQILLVNVIGGSGDLHLLLGGALVYTDLKDGTASIYAKGTSSYCLTQTKYESHGVIDYRDLEIHRHDIHHRGTNRIYTKAFSFLNVKNYNNGEIHYLKYKKKTRDFIPPDEEYPWGHYEYRWHFCPEAIYFNGNYINSWTYNNETPGLVKFE